MLYNVLFLSLITKNSIRAVPMKMINSTRKVMHEPLIKDSMN